MTIVRFDEVRLRTRRAGKCSKCGKRTSRTQSFWQTLNPFNRNASGAPKTREEITAELHVQLKAWHGKPLRCTGCE